MAKQFEILGIGNAIMDVIAPVSEQLLIDQNIDKGGMTLIDETTALALHKALSAAAQTREIAGGSAANTMVGIAELGVSSAYMGKIAKDDVGMRFNKGITDSGLTFKTTPADHGATGRCLIAVTPDGERSMSTLLGVATEFTVDDVDADFVKNSAIVYLEGYLFNSKATKAAFVKASEIAQAAGNQVALTLSDSFCVELHRASFKHLVDNHVDILFANEAEIFSLYETDNIDTALDALTGSRTVACITRSDKGSIIQTPERRYHIKAAKVEKVVDTTGAGDQYAAGVLAGRALGLGWEHAGALGSIAAAEVISHYGARPETSIKALAKDLFA